MGEQFRYISELNEENKAREIIFVLFCWKEEGGKKSR